MWCINFTSYLVHLQISWIFNHIPFLAVSSYVIYSLNTRKSKFGTVMVATIKVAALWDLTRVPTFQGIIPLMFVSGIIRNVSTRLPDLLMLVLAGLWDVSAVPDGTMYMSVDRSLHKKKWLPFRQFCRLCVFWHCSGYWLSVCSGSVLDSFQPLR